MKNIKLKEDIYWIGSIDEDLREFDVVLNAEFGTTYNSYLVRGSEKNALVDTVKHTKIEEFLENLKEIIDIKEIDYIIINHAEPDHTGSIGRILEENPNIQIVGSKAALMNLREITNMELNEIAVRDNSTLSLGNKTFRFFTAPMLHWPDTIFSYLEEDKAIFTCDSFGSHYAMEIPLQSKISDQEEYLRGFHYYFEKILAPFNKFMLKAITKIENLNIDMVCTGHGPILDEDPWKIINYTKELALKGTKNSTPIVVIPYVTSYGYTEKMAGIIEDILIAEGIETEKYNMTYASRDIVAKHIQGADGVLFGSPTMLGDALFPIWELLIRINPFEHGIKYGGVFGSYGWSGEGITHVDERLKQLKMKRIEPFKLKFDPSDEDIEGIKQFAREFATMVKS